MVLNTRPDLKYSVPNVYSHTKTIELTFREVLQSQSEEAKTKQINKLNFPYY